MRIDIDADRCQGHGRCLDRVPDVFGYDDVTNVAYVVEGADLDLHREAIHDAAAACPESAITLLEDGEAVTTIAEK